MFNTGPDGDLDPARPLAQISWSAPTAASNAGAASGLEGAVDGFRMPQVSGAPGPQRFEGLATAKVTAKRKLYFSETSPSRMQEPTFFITVDGATPVAFSPDNPPAITTTQGSVEDWTVENRSLERVTNFTSIRSTSCCWRAMVSPFPPAQRQYLDMVNVPFWKGKGPYPSVKVRMDFRGPDIGDFVYHCHILEHEDNGMMAIIRVLPANRRDASTGTSGHAAMPALSHQAAPANPATHTDAAPSRVGVKLVTLAK